MFDAPWTVLSWSGRGSAFGGAVIIGCTLFAFGCSLDLPRVMDDAGSSTGGDGGPEGGLDGEPADDADASTCAPGYKPCVAQCVPIDDPEYGCAAAGCEPCVVSHATSKCSGGVCSIGQCNDGWADCDGERDTGCEVELAVDSLHCGQCNDDCKGGSCSDGLCDLIPVATGFAKSWAVAVDEVYAYFTVGIGEHGLFRVAKTGGLPEPLATDAPAGEGDVALDATHVYWTNRTAGAVNRVAKAGGTTETLASSSSPLGVVVDDEHVYWVDLTDNAVLRAAKTAPATAEVFMPGLDRGKLLTQDSNALYASAITGDLFRIPKDGGAVVQVGLGSGGDTDGWGVAVDSQWVCWVSSSDLLKVPKAGGTQTKLGSGLQYAKVMAVDAGQLFICTHGDTGELWTAPTSGASPLRSLGPASGCHGIAVDDEFVYITRHQPEPGLDAGVFRVARPPPSP